MRLSNNSKVVLGLISLFLTLPLLTGIKIGINPKKANNFLSEKSPLEAVNLTGKENSCFL